MRAQFTLFSLLFASSAAHAEMTLNLTEGVTPLSHDVYALHMLIFWVCVGIGILVFGTMLYSILYHRKSSGFQAVPFHEKTSVELTWTIIPLLILILMAIPATHVLIAMSHTDKEDLTIKVTGYQWKWKYDYLNQGVSFFSNISPAMPQLNPQDPHYLRNVDHPLVVPIHKKIRFLMTSNDVIHSWWVPALGVKRDALPGFINEAWAEIDKAGTYYGQCTELCGINHAFMIIVVKAVTEQEFENWITQQKGGAIPAPTAAPTVTPSAAATTSPATVAPKAPAANVQVPAGLPNVPAPAPAAAPAKKLTLDELMKHGEQVFLSICAVCHQPNGEGMPPTFPALKGSPIATGPLDAHINRVLNGKPGTAMQAFKEQLNDDDLAAVITYERNAWGNHTGTLVQPSDIAAARAKLGATP